MRKISDKTRKKQKRGTGEGKDYKPFIKGREFNSLGTCAAPIDYTTGRQVNLHSQGELYLWYLLKFQDDIIDIREHYPLDNKEVHDLVTLLGIYYPDNITMTTDMLVTYTDNHLEAYSVKPDDSIFQNKRTCEKLYLEKQYWERKGVKYHLVLKSRLNVVLAENIRVCSYYRDPTFIQDRAGCLKHLIITKQIRPEISTQIINIQKLLIEYEKEVEHLWKILHLEQDKLLQS